MGAGVSNKENARKSLVVSGDETQWAFLKNTGSKLRFWNDRYWLYLWYETQGIQKAGIPPPGPHAVAQLSSGAQE